MMDNSCSVNLDKWRDYFNASDYDIFDMINNAIMVAATDYPIVFKQKRVQIVETLFSCTEIKFSRCDINEPRGVEIGVNQLEETEDLAQIAEKKTCKEVLIYKEILDNGEKEADIVINELLKLLKRKGLTYQILEKTKIGKTVNALRNHGSKDVRDRVRSLIKDWKAMVDREWFQSKEVVADAVIVKELERTQGFAGEDHGLTVPPMDYHYLHNLPIDPTLEDYSEFLNGKDDFGNLPNDVELSKNQVNVTKTHPGKKIPILKLDSKKDSSTFTKNKLIEQKPSSSPAPHRPKPQIQRVSIRESTLIKWKPSKYIQARPKPILQPKDTRRECVPCRLKPKVQPQRPRRECILGLPVQVDQPRIKNGIMVQRKTDRDVIQKNFMKPQHDVDISRKKVLDGTKKEISIHAKLETSKRKIQERYQDVQNAKKPKAMKAVKFKD